MILHVDMDAFYASIEQRDNPALRGIPLVVGGSAEGRGVVATANYEARRFGIHSAMPVRKALSLCPNLTIVRPRMDVYAQVSKEIREIFESFTPIVEPLSFDEAFLDVRETAHLFGGPEQIGRSIKETIQTRLGLIASVGIAPNKFLAKIASDIQKPDALVLIQPDQIESFLDPLPIERLWGVGKATGATMKRISIRTIGDLKRLNLVSLQDLFGNSAQHYWELARGIDERVVIPYREAKSVSSETTFPEDISSREDLHGCLVYLVESVSRRLRTHGWKGKGVEVKMRYHDFHSITRSQILPNPTDLTAELLRAANQLFQTKIPQDNRPVRLLGFGIHHLRQDTYQQLSLFDQPQIEKQRSLDQVTDLIANKFGRNAIRRAEGNRSPSRRDR
ncbi:DNA polymerase IV [Pirellulaceae bacterium SH501]